MELCPLTSDAEVICPNFILVPFLYHYMGSSGFFTPFHRTFERFAELCETCAVLRDSLTRNLKTMDLLKIIEAKINELRHTEKCKCSIRPERRQY
jgi:hypothetical protein